MTKPNGRKKGPPRKHPTVMMRVDERLKEWFQDVNRLYREGVKLEDILKGGRE